MPSGVKDIQLLELKDTISQLNKTISTQNELISSLQKMLEERNAKDSEKDLLIANLQSQLAYLKNKVFGSTSEIRHDQLDGQLNLFGTPVGDEKPAEVIEPEVISVKGYTKERKPKATYDDKYNSVRSICKHFFTDIVGLSIKFFCVSLRHMSIGAGVIVAISFHQVDHTPHSQTGTEGNNERLKDRNRLIDKFHRVTSLIFECELLKMGKKIEAPSLFCFGHCPCAVHDGASIGFNLSHVIEVEGLGGLDYQLVRTVFLDVKGVALIVVGQLRLS